MSGAVEQVAALEAETAEAVAAAQVAQEAAASAVASAAVLENQVVIEAAQQAAELESEVAQNKDDISWMRELMTALEASQSQMLKTMDSMAAMLLVLTEEPEPPAASTESQSATSETPPPSSVAVADLQVAENPASQAAPEKPSPKPKKHRLV